MEFALTIMALLFFAFVVLGVYAAVKAGRAAARGIDRTIDQAKRTVEDTTLRARSLGQGGVAGELAQLRLALRNSMRATQTALESGVAEDASLHESLALFKRLSGHARELDDDLKSLEREPDRSGVAAQLPGLRERTEQITKSAESLRWAARDRARKFADDDLATLSAQIDMEAGALRHWSEEPGSEPQPERTATRPASASASTPGTGDGAATGDRVGTGRRSAAWPEADGASPEAEQVWPDGDEADAARTAGSADEAGRPRELPAPDPRLTTYPWEKSARPETTN
ncbi:hypothetical protein ABZO31_10525 [Streptomyces sp. HUAS MG47]|uniref:hypothetical protein n=1 Tax=Streptomyces solicamelliae TaxID=3231716 RepID=UPI003877DE70